MLVRDNKGREYWRRTKVEIERHFLVRDIDSVSNGDEDEEEDEVVNGYLADLAVSTPLDTDKPLWEFHLLRNQRCCVLRFHHALGDGISLISLALACCRRVHHPDQPATISSSSSSSKISNTTSTGTKICRKVWGLVAVAWFTLVFVVGFLLRSLWVKDAKTALSGGAGVELWPRKIATARFVLEDMKAVKKAIADAVASLLNYRIVCNTSFSISNVIGPQEEIMLAGNPITYLRANASSLPNAITMHMVSYAGSADMQILVAKDIIPDPQVLAKCFQDALLEMKDAATALATTNSIEDGNFS
ncbi:hypothetical protein HHK36_030957 [Tetracentron sinense]|uniref:O-acyltransferase WSD1 C-terminal domain-containing protein n=1 Tax=Tetracentron sinense TaxID=13715 RepID=A0A835CZ69_TETSI|nr:hypothetical protein HHK36_030957 [Tetracentron sinense]